jgi:hypothetical protein
MMRRHPRQLNRRTINAFVATICLLFGVESNVRPVHAQSMGEATPSVQSILRGNPQRDFERAKGKGDLHFLAVRGITVEIPGVPADVKTRFRTVKVEPISGTGDVLDAVQTKDARRKIRRYAEIYNRLVVSELERGKAH